LFHDVFLGANRDDRWLLVSEEVLGGGFDLGGGDGLDLLGGLAVVEWGEP